MPEEIEIANTPEDPTAGAVGVTVSGKDYIIEWNFAALVKAERVTGANLLFSALEFRGMTATTYAGMLWAALQTHQPKMTIADVINLITPKTWSEFTNAMLKAWGQVKPEEAADEAPNPQAPDA